MRLLLLLLGTVAPYGQKDPEEPPKNFQSLYEEGREAYLENRFPDCVKLFEAALRDYGLYTRAVVDCKTKCKRPKTAGPTLHDQDMLHYQRLIEETLCNMKCKLRALPRGRPETVKEDIRAFFEERKPYDFLQLCYYQTGKHQAAASAAYTNLAVNPEAETMRENLAYYLALPGVARAEVVDLEAKAWVGPYLAGRAHYAQEDWGPMVEAMEESLKLYLREEEECRLACDKPFDQKWYPDFTSSVANHFTFCLKCRRNCPENLNNLNGEFTEDLVATFYHHLQFGYYHLGQAGRAAAAARSFLLLLPDHGDMQGNLAYYRQQPGGGVGGAPAREETVAYLRREEDEERLLDFITKSFVFPEDGLLEEEAMASTVDSPPKVEEEPLVAKRATGRSLPGFLARPHRRLEDGLLAAGDCTQLLSLAQLVTHPGDGYTDTPMDPGGETLHSPAEELRGVTVGKLALFVLYGLAEVGQLELLLRTGETVRQRSQALLSPNRTLHCTYTHLVCRHALPGPKVRDAGDLSHAVHADNCQLGPGGCDRGPPAYAYRAVSALLYLSKAEGHFTGGRFFFASRDPVGGSALVTTDTVAPACGRLLAFTSGPENLHGVRQVAAGTRCVLALWFSHDPAYWEPEIGLAWDLVDSLAAGRPPAPTLRERLEELTLLSEPVARRVLEANSREKRP